MSVYELVGAAPGRLSTDNTAGRRHIRRFPLPSIQQQLIIG